MSVNKIILIGRLTKDPETKQVGTSNVTNFTIVTNEKYKNKAGEQVEEAEFHDCVIWGDRGLTLAKYKKKGEELYVEGSVKTRTWEHEGKKQYRQEVKVFNFTFIGGGGGNAQAATTPQSQAPNSQQQIDDDLPF